MYRFIMDFSKEHSFEERTQESGRMRSKYPDRIPCIISKHYTSSEIPSIDKTKFLVPQDFTIGQLMWVVRKRIKLKQEQSLFLFCGTGNIPASSATMKHIDKDYINKDGFLYFTYSGENTFGFRNPLSTK